MEENWFFEFLKNSNVPNNFLSTTIYNYNKIIMETCNKIDFFWVHLEFPFSFISGEF